MFGDQEYFTWWGNTFLGQASSQTTGLLDITEGVGRS